MHHQEPVGAGALQLDLHFPEIKGTTYASHPDQWRKAWKRYVGEWAKFPDVVWQIGLRGRRDALDRRYNSGKWEHWYDRDMVYPSAVVVETLRKHLRKLQDGNFGGQVRR